MAQFSRLIRFESATDGKTCFADLGTNDLGHPSAGSQITSFASIGDLSAKKNESTATMGKLLAPIPNDGAPIYCVGLNYKTHAAEANMTLPAHPPLWTKPAAALAAPGEDIPVNEFCATSLLDYEGELVFVTSRDCRDLSEADAENYILGYTIGNDLSCRKFQMPDQCGGQFFFAKAFDKFAPIGPALLSPHLFDNGKGLKIMTRVNGKMMQDSEFVKDFVFTPAQCLSFMSQGTTIPAGTAVMTGTPSGVGIFQNPRVFLKDGDIVEVEVSKIGILKNKIVFQ